MLVSQWIFVYQVSFNEKVFIFYHDYDFCYAFHFLTQKSVVFLTFYGNEAWQNLFKYSHMNIEVSLLKWHYSFQMLDKNVVTE